MGSKAVICSLTALLQQFRYQPGPAGLVTGAEARAVVCRGNTRKKESCRASWDQSETSRRAAIHRPPADAVTQKDMRKPPRDFRSNLAQVHHLTRAGRALNLEAIAEIVMKLLQRFDDQIVERKPDRAAPI